MITATALDETLLNTPEDPKKFLVVRQNGQKIEAYLEDRIIFAWPDELTARIELLRMQFNGYSTYWQ
jgi:hypothetical protein